MKVLLLYPPREPHLANLQRAAPSAIFSIAQEQRAAAELIREADAVLGNRWLSQSLPFAEKLRWAQSGSMGMDLVLNAREALQSVVLTRVKEVYDDEVAEHATALALALVRGLHLARDAQRDAAWRPGPLRTLQNMRVLVMGWGGIGRGIAQRLQALGAQVCVVRRSPAEPVQPVKFLGAEWRQRLPEVDVLFLALPSTPSTRNLIGKQELSMLPATSYLVNVGRGETLDEDSLLEAVREGRLAGAALDVMREEPLPPENPLWLEPHILLTPHVARSQEPEGRRWEPVFEENLRRFAAGEPMLYVVDQEQGY